MPADKPQFFRRELYRSRNLHAPGTLRRNSKTLRDFHGAPSESKYYGVETYTPSFHIQTQTTTSELEREAVLESLTLEPNRRRQRLAYVAPNVQTYTLSFDVKQPITHHNQNAHISPEYAGVTGTLSLAILWTIYSTRQNLLKRF